MTAPSLATLLVKQAKAAFYETALAIAETVGLNVSTWQVGDPTRAQFHLQSEALEALDSLRADFTASGFLDYATGIWLKILAHQVYGIEVPEASAATTDVVLTNTGGGLYADIEAGDLTFKNSTTEKTYHNTTGGTLAAGPGTTLTITVVADEAGSDSSAGAGEIDEMVTQLLGVTCTNPTAAIGTDEQDESVTRDQCRAKLASLSANGPKGAYAYVLRNPELSGLTYVPRVRTYSDSDIGEVRIIVAGPSGAISAGDRALAEAAVLAYATPLCITPVVQSAANVTVAITYELWIYARSNKTATEAAADVAAALAARFADLPIGGDVIPPSTTGKLYRSLVESTILATFGDDAFRVSVTVPAGDTTISDDQVAALGTVTPTIHIVVDP
jgi:hypothetical protein